MKYIKRKNLLKLFQPSLPSPEVLAQELEKLGDTGKQVWQEIERLKQKNNKLKKKINRLRSKDVLNTLILSCVIIIIFSIGYLVTNEWLETLVFTMVVTTLIGIFPISYIAYLFYREQVQIERLKDDLKLLGLVDKEKLNEVDKLYQTVYNPSQFVVYITLLVSLSAIIFGAYYAFVTHRSSVFDFLTKINIEIIFYSFLGAYFWGIQLVVRRYNTFDLQPQVFSSIVLRTLLSAVITFGSASLINQISEKNLPSSVSELPAQTSQNEKSATEPKPATSLPDTGSFVPLLAFLIGIFPSQGIRWLNVTASRIFNAPVDQYSERPLAKIVGINTWHEARLLELGIDNVQSLATVDMCKLLLTTRFDTHQIVNWVDQAILHMKVGAKIDRFLEAKITTFHELHIALVKFSPTPIVSENEVQVCQYKESKQLDQNIAGVLGVTTLAEIQFLCDYSNYPNYAYIQEYYTAIDEVARQRAQSGKQDVIGTLQEQFSIGGTLLAVAQDSNGGSRDLLNNLQDREKIEDEIQRLHSHLNNNLENARLLTALGTRYYLIGKKDDALKAYNYAIELDVQLAEAYSNRSLIYIDQGDYEQAIRDNITAIRINRNYAGAFNNLGLAHRCQNNLLSAMESFEEALRLNPRLAVTYYNRGVIGNTIAKTEKEFQKAAYDFERAYLLGHDSPSLWSSWGLALCNLGEYRDAIDKLNQAIFLTKDEAALAYARRGYAYLQLGSEFYSKAGFDFEQAIQKNDSLAYTYANYGLLKAREGRDEEAIELYNKAITLGENNYAIHCNLAAAYSRMRQWSEAIAHCLQAIELGDEQATTRYNLAMAYNQSGKKAEAVEMLMQVKGLHKSPELESTVEALLERLTKEEE